PPSVTMIDSRPISFSARIGYGPPAMRHFARQILAAAICVAAVGGILVTLSEPIAAADPQPTFPIRAAFAYPWFPEAWSQGGVAHYTNYTPSLGWYDSSDSSVIASQIGAMQYAGMEAGIASWWGQGSATDSRVPLLLQGASGSTFRWSLYYEREGSSDPTVAQLSSDLGYIATKYGANPSYLRVNGKPVIFVYADGADGCGMVDRWTQANAGRFHVVLKVFPGYKTCANQPQGWHQYAPAVASDSQAGYSYAISPGFYKKGETAPRLARDPARWTANVQAMVASNAPWQLVTTFNEWGEGTAVESAQQWASSSGYGTYLDTLHQYLGGSPPTTTIAPTTTTPTTTAVAPAGVCNNAGSPAARQKVVVFSFENRTWSGVGGTQFDPQAMPYLHSLATQCATWADYTEPDRSQNSATQYVGTTAGGTQNTVRDDCSPSSTCRSTQNNIFRQARRNGKVPRSFVEGATAGCSAGGNAAKHVSALYFFGTYTDGAGTHNDHDFCNGEVRPYSEFNPNALPDFSFVTPTLCNDGHDCANSAVDTWAAANVKRVIDSAAYKAGNVTVFIWYDEDHPVPNMQIGLHVAAGVRTAPIDYRTELRVWEDLLGVPRIDTLAPSNAQIVGLPLISTTLSSTVKWIATDNTGVKSYDVRYRSAPYNSTSYGSYITFKSATAATSGAFTGSAGRTYCFSVRARDANSNLGAWGQQSCVGFPVDERTMTAAGTWAKVSSSSYYASTAMASTIAGATLKLSVAYRRIYVIATKCSGCGFVNVYLGSTLLKSVDLSATATTNRAVFPIEISSTIKSGTITLKQSSAGRSVTVDGLGIYLG
ncbi:MAG: hypothetical protein QOI44_518, partial [Actinomycetota bacterium]|nr:hypothetical protein [Actinomycetota bacterium]